MQIGRKEGSCPDCDDCPVRPFFCDVCVDTVKKTADEWNKDPKMEVRVFDPDGWPRNDPEAFQRLWFETPMTRDEFGARAMQSTCTWKVKLGTD